MEPQTPNRPPKPKLSSLRKILLILVPLLTVLYTITFSFSWSPSPSWSRTRLPGGLVADRLVVYVFSNTDEEYLTNLEFFVREGMSEGDGCDYVIIVQEDPGSEPTVLPRLPRNAAYVNHANECYDWGTFGWLINGGFVNVAKYKYFIFMNSSIRGPFFPAYWDRKFHWSQAFIAKLTSTVKLVGATINCEGVRMMNGTVEVERRNPHVQSYLVATDKVGLKTLQDSGTVFGCYEKLVEVIFYAELGSSLAILNAGFTIDSLMVRYQGIDWTDPRHWECNSRLNPYTDSQYDGIFLHPFETLFAKIKRKDLLRDWEHMRSAVKYDTWLQNSHMGAQERQVSSNEWIKGQWKKWFSRMLVRSVLGSGCFDAEYYARNNEDLAAIGIVSKQQLWQHFLLQGQMESNRPFKMQCEYDYYKAFHKMVSWR